MQKIAKVQATRTQAPAELALLILVANDLSGCQPWKENLPVSCLEALAPVVVDQIHQLKYAQILPTALVEFGQDAFWNKMNKHVWLAKQHPSESTEWSREKNCSFQSSAPAMERGWNLRNVTSWRNVLYEKAITHANTCQQAICGVRQRGWPVCSGLLEKENCPSWVSSCQWHITLTKNFLLEQCMLGQSANCINFATTKAHSSVVTFLQFLRPINEVRILASHWECILSVNGSCHSSK